MLEVAGSENATTKAKNQKTATTINVMIETFFWWVGAVAQAVGIVKSAGMNQSAVSGASAQMEYHEK